MASSKPLSQQDLSADIPAGIPSFLLPQFDSIAKAEGLSANYRIEHQPGAKPGDGFMSEMIAVTLVDDASADKNNLRRVALVCKLQPQSIERKVHATVFASEVFAYTRVFPEMLKLQREKGLTDESNGGFFAIPKCYAAAHDNETPQSFLIMGDLRPQDFSMWPREQTVEFEHVRQLLTQLGRFHGLSFVMRDQRPEVFAEWMTTDKVFRELIKSKPSHSLFDSTYRRAVRLLERTEDRRLMEKLRREWFSLFMQQTDVQRMGEFAMFGHGDCWNNNLLYRFENDKKPSSICLLDWQFSRPAGPADDLIMYLSSSTEKSLRDRHYTDFLRIYYDSLSEIVRRCGSDPERLFPYDAFVGSLRSHGLYGILEAPLTVALMVADSENVADIDLMAAQAGTVAEEDETGHFVHLNARTEVAYRKRLADVLVDARQYGWISFDVQD